MSTWRVFAPCCRPECGDCLPSSTGAHHDLADPRPRALSWCAASAFADDARRKHSLRIVGEGFRRAQIARLGPNAWKGLYSVASIVGFALIVWGWSVARQQPTALWVTPVALRHVASLLTLVAFVLLAAAYVPGNGIKARLHHPMVLGVKVWALAHLLANNSVADLLLFGSFLVWAVSSFRAARARDRVAGTVYPPGTLVRTALTVVIGLAAWAAFAFWAHEAWIGVRPIG